MRLVVVVVALLVPVSCARSLEELVPFACAAFNEADPAQPRCPGDLLCVDGACVNEKDCDIGEPRCAEQTPERPKCTVVEIDDGAHNQQCVRLIKADVDPGELCARRGVAGSGDSAGDADDAFGLDNCVEEHFCADPRDPDEQGFCDKPEDCDGLLACQDLVVDGESIGICVPICSDPDALDDGGCDQNETCKRSLVDVKGKVFSACARDGLGEPAAPCTGDHQCRSDAVCEAGVCVPACNSENLCGAGAVCTSLAAAPGFCRPQ